MRTGSLSFSLAFVLAASFLVAESIYLWPYPKTSHHGWQYLHISKDFGMSLRGGAYKDDTGILKDGFSRFLQVVKMGQVVDGNFSFSDNWGLLAGLNVAIFSSDTELQYGIDESYSLTVPATGNPIHATLQAQTVYGALHGLQTLSQMFNFNSTTKTLQLELAPWNVVDQPRFPYRGLLIDTARHYQPVSQIKKVIDAMAYAKLNVLHWHIVDTQSFPIEIPSYPKLSDGSFTASERYTMNDAAEIVQYAQRRGINVLAEIDVPGHAQSWGVGYPSLWPSANCQQPLDVSNEFTFQVISGILSDFSKVFKFRFVHLGGDEVDTSCWTTTPHIRKWLRSRGLNESQAYEYFVLRAQNIALSHGYEIVNWEETFNNFGSKLSPKTVVHNWLGGGVAQKVVAAGLRCIVSNQDKWYLNYLDTTWQEVYMNEPLANITDPAQQKLVIGGEVCMWGEQVDASDLEQTIWPRAAAAAERLWTSYDRLAKDPVKAMIRLSAFRCLLAQRGVAAGPLLGGGRAVPEGPGSCFKQ